MVDWKVKYEYCLDRAEHFWVLAMTAESDEKMIRYLDSMNRHENYADLIRERYLNG